MKILIIGFKYNHHSFHSGYDKFIDYLPNKINIEYFNLYKYLFFKNSNKLYLNILHRLNHRVLLLHLKYRLKRFEQKFDLVHFIYPEDTLKKVKINKTNKNVKYLATFHQPDFWFKNLTTTEINNLSIIDSAILLGWSQAEAIKNCLKINNIFFIPHGIDNLFFKNLNLLRLNNRILVVGSWLRDLNLLHEIINFYNRNNHDVIFDLVLGTKSSGFKKYKNCVVHNNITNHELLLLYNNTNLVLFVLNDSVANNALLESISTSNAIIINNVGSILDYVDKDSVILIKKDLEHYIDAINNFLNNDPKLEYYRRKASFLTNKLSWINIASEIQKLYYKNLNEF